MCTSFCFLAKPVRLSARLLNCLLKSVAGYNLKAMCPFLYIVIIVFYLKVALIINDNQQELMIIKELFENR